MYIFTIKNDVYKEFFISLGTAYYTVKPKNQYIKSY